MSLVLQLTDLPEPDDLFATASVMSVDGVSLPVSEVDLLHATQHHLWQDASYKHISCASFYSPHEAVTVQYVQSRC